MVKRRRNDLVDILGQSGFRVTEFEEESPTGQFDLEWDIGNETTHDFDDADEIYFSKMPKTEHTLEKKVKVTNPHQYPIAKVMIKRKNGTPLKLNLKQKIKLKNQIRHQLYGASKQISMLPLIAEYEGDDLYIYADLQVTHMIQRMRSSEIFRDITQKTGATIDLTGMNENYIRGTPAIEKLKLRLARLETLLGKEKEHSSKKQKQIRVYKTQKLRDNQRIRTLNTALRNQLESMASEETIQLRETVDDLRKKIAVYQNRELRIRQKIDALHLPQEEKIKLIPKPAKPRKTSSITPSGLPECVYTGSPISAIAYLKAVKTSKLSPGLRLAQYYKPIFPDKAITEEQFVSLITRGKVPTDPKHRQILEDRLSLTKDERKYLVRDINDKRRPLVYVAGSELPTIVKPTNFGTYLFKKLRQEYGDYAVLNHYAKRFIDLSEELKPKDVENVLVKGIIPTITIKKEAFLEALVKLGADPDEARILLDLDSKKQQKAVIDKNTGRPTYLNPDGESIKTYEFFSKRYGPNRPLREYINLYANASHIDKVALYRFIRDATPLPPKENQILSKDMKLN